MDKSDIILLVCIIFLIVFIISFSIFNVFYRFFQAKIALEDCKARGYDGIKFINKFTNEVECSNFANEGGDAP